MSWRLQPLPDNLVNWSMPGRACSEGPVATLADEYGGRAHIIVDDHCYLLLLEHADGECQPTAWWFAAAVEALQTLPARPDEARDRYQIEREQALGQHPRS
jgi:hypothetical protein